MCGIVGCVGNTRVLPIVIGVLKKLEYRGYDSTGIAVNTDNHIEFRKGIGSLDQVAETLDFKSLQGETGIGHFRWATHGQVTAANAHPLCDCSGRIALAHNGIIVNYQELKAYDPDRLRNLAKSVTII